MRDINFDAIRNFIDRSEVDFEARGCGVRKIKTNLTLIGTTNQLYFNRRISIIPFLEKKGKAISFNKLKLAWSEALRYCPYDYIDIKTINQKMVGKEVFVGEIKKQWKA